MAGLSLGLTDSTMVYFNGYQYTPAQRGDGIVISTKVGHFEPARALFLSWRRQDSRPLLLVTCPLFGGQIHTREVIRRRGRCTCDIDIAGFPSPPAQEMPAGRNPTLSFPAVRDIVSVIFKWFQHRELHIGTAGKPQFH